MVRGRRRSLRRPAARRTQPGGGDARPPRLLIASAGALGLVASLNVVVNPFGSYATHLFEPMVLHSRADKLRLLDAAPPPDVVILGSSASFAMAPEQIRRRTGLSAFNASVHGGTPRDYHALLLHLQERGTWPKVVLVALSFEQLRPTARVGFEPGDPLTAYVSDERRPALSVPRRRSSPRTRRKRPCRRLRASVEGTAPPPAYRSRRTAAGLPAVRPASSSPSGRGGNPELTFADIDPRQWGHLRAVLDACRERGTRVIAFLPPLHPSCARSGGRRRASRRSSGELQRRLAAYVPQPVLAVHDFRRVESYGGRPELFRTCAIPTRSRTG
jgi:hypothetical protein